MKTQITFISIFLMIVFSCSSPKDEASESEAVEQKGLIGYVELNDPLEVGLVTQGASIFTAKCARCHTIDTVEFLVPSFAGVTNRRSPEWIMNMIINVDEMLKTDPTARELLRKHKKVMPDPMLNVDQARAVLEFLRNNDLEQLGEKDKAAKQ